MKIVIIGGTGLIGSTVVRILTDQGHEAIAASPTSGVNTLTGDGLAGVMDGADVVVDVSNAPSFEDAAVLDFFRTSTTNLLAAEAAAGVGHHVALSVVGAERMPESGYQRAKVAQEQLIKAGAIPYTIVRATQFFEFATSIAQDATDGNTVRLPSVLIQPVAADDVAAAVARTALGTPLNGTIEVGGPEQLRFEEFIGAVLRASNDGRTVLTDPSARYFGAVLYERTLVAGPDARIAATRFEDWLKRPVPQR